MSTLSNSSNCCEPTRGYCSVVNRVAKFVLIWALLVICLGGKTKSKEAGLTIADPVIFEWHWDWLTVENLNAEYTHRIVAFLLACSSLALCVLVFLKDMQKGVKILAGLLVAAIVAQAVLGALTVHYLAAAASSIPHAIFAQVTFSLAACMVVVTSKAWMSDTKPIIDLERPTLFQISRSLAIAMFIQLLLGAALRHDDKAAALRNGHEFIFWSHLIAHITGALAVTYFMGRMLLRVFSKHRAQKEILKPARLFMMLLGVQLMLGVGAAILKVMTKDYDSANSPPPLRVWVATSHVATGAVMMALSVVIALNAYRYISAGQGKPADKIDTDAVGVPA